MIELITQWHASIMDPDRIPLAIAAIFVVIVIGVISGPLAGNANPFIWLVFDKFLGGFGDRLDRVERQRGDLIFRGFIISAIAVVIIFLIGKALAEYVLIYPVYGITETLLLSLTITCGSAWFALLRLYFALDEHKDGKNKKQIGQGAYYAISRSTRTNLSISDDYGIARAGMSYAARSFDKGLVSPILWYLIGGLPLAFIYTALAALAWRFGKDGFTKGFGSVPLALERLLGFVPSIYAAFMITFAGLFTPTAKMHKGIASWLGHKSRARYEQGGFPLSALAWSLNVSIGGASQDLSGSAIKSEWAGPDGASAKIDYKHLRRAIYISVMAHILFLASLCSAYLWAGRLF